jgi:hypothetical protein
VRLTTSTWGEMTTQHRPEARGIAPPVEGARWSTQTGGATTRHALTFTPTTRRLQAMAAISLSMVNPASRLE